MDRKEILYSGKAGSGSRIYYFDVHETSKKDLYVEITERTRKENEWESRRILIYNDHIDEFIEELLKTAKYISENSIKK